MALSDDQRAMLRLLAQREQGYGDLAALMGLSVDEVRAKVKEALDQLEADGEAQPKLPAEPPAAEKPPAPAQPAPPVAAPEPEPPAAPPAPEPAAPVAAPATEASAAPPSPRAPRRPKPSLPSGNGPRAAIAVGVLAVIALVVVLLVSGGGDSGGDTTGSGSGDTNSEETVNTSGDGKGKDVTQAVLDPVGGGDATGIAVFGRVKNSLALQVEATGLAPSSEGESYTVWLYESPGKMLPLASTTIGKSGKLAAQVAVPTEVLGYLANETFDQIDISLTSNATLKASLAKATREKKAPIYTGTDVLRGQITGPIIGAAKK
jgi:hypothetical protein